MQSPRQNRPCSYSLLIQELASLIGVPVADRCLYRNNRWRELDTHRKTGLRRPIITWGSAWLITNGTIVPGQDEGAGCVPCIKRRLPKAVTKRAVGSASALERRSRDKIDQNFGKEAPNALRHSIAPSSVNPNPSVAHSPDDLYFDLSEHTGQTRRRPVG